MIGGVVLYFSATAERIVAKGSATAENIAVKSFDGENIQSSNRRHFRVFVHYGTAMTEEIQTKSSDRRRNQFGTQKL